MPGKCLAHRGFAMWPQRTGQSYLGLLLDRIPVLGRAGNCLVCSSSVTWHPPRGRSALALPLGTSLGRQHSGIRPLGTGFGLMHPPLVHSYLESHPCNWSFLRSTCRYLARKGSVRRPLPPIRSVLAKPVCTMSAHLVGSSPVYTTRWMFRQGKPPLQEQVRCMSLIRTQTGIAPQDRGSGPLHRQSPRSFPDQRGCTVTVLQTQSRYLMDRGSESSIQVLSSFLVGSSRKRSVLGKPGTFRLGIPPG